MAAKFTQNRSHFHDRQTPVFEAETGTQKRAANACTREMSRRQHVHRTN